LDLFWSVGPARQGLGVAKEEQNEIFFIVPCVKAVDLKRRGIQKFSRVTLYFKR
jgi:hypothetical protein